ncbi:PRC-barrel domain-containing protein [Zavarzinia compransoris]|uniref:PRC-barrel domain-containing protein n=1 Tax=Zavarzinia marina TaxID=2911065 RepID=UPI001F1BC26F|nr:PRC-barrel domain-containing protein [Zavarzinia marina]MCF4165937.1 PRC-barrel domain-containing protein [Zavarzinia marina]
MNKTMTAAVLTTLLAGATVPAIAAETMSPATAPEATVPPAGAEASVTADPVHIGAALRAGDLIGTEVTNVAGDEVGEVTDLVIGENNTFSAAIVSVGGFLGVGDKEVAIALADLTVTPVEDGEYRVVVAATRDQLEAMPEVELN